MARLPVKSMIIRDPNIALGSLSIPDAQAFPTAKGISIMTEIPVPSIDPQERATRYSCQAGSPAFLTLPVGHSFSRLVDLPALDLSRSQPHCLRSDSARFGRSSTTVALGLPG